MAEKEKGYIRLYRSLCDHWVWEQKPMSRGQAWVDLLLLADYKAKRIEYKGQIIEGQHGTVFRSITWLADRWGWSRNKARRFLKLLERDGMVTVKATAHYTTITLVNYGNFQYQGPTSETANETASGQQADSRRTASGQQADTYNKRNKLNKGNKGKKDIEPSGSDSETENEPDWQAIWDSLPDATPGIEGAEE